jgi:hypothetical protein
MKDLSKDFDGKYSDAKIMATIQLRGNPPLCCRQTLNWADSVTMKPKAK